MRKYLQAIRYKCIFAVFLTLSRFWIWFIFWLRKSFEQALLLQKKWIGWGEKYGSIGKKIGRENSHLKPCIYFLVHNFAFKITFVTVFCCNDPHICSHISFWKFLLFHVCYGQSFLSTSKQLKSTQWPSRAITGPALGFWKFWREFFVYYHIDANTTALLIRAAVWVKYPLFCPKLNFLSKYSIRTALFWQKNWMQRH